MADELSLLWKIRGDASGVKQALAESRAAVTQLKQSFGPELTQAVSLSNKVFADLGENLTDFVGQRIPLVGNAFVRVTGNLRGLNDEMKKGGPQTEALARQIDGIAKASGKSTTEVSRFLTSFVKLESQSARNNAAFKTFGGSVDLIGNKTAKFLPELEQAGTQLASLSDDAATAGAALGGIALPIGIAVAAIAAMVGGVVILSRELIELTKTTADFQGKMFDLSQATGLGVETLSTLEVAAKTTGGSLDSIAASLGIFQKRLEEARDPTSKAADSLKELGVTSTDTEVALRQTLAALARMPEGAAQTATALELFGRGGRQVLAILKETNGDLDGLTRKLREAGILITTDTARSADILNDELALLDFQIRAAGADIVKELIPALADAARNLAEVVKATRPLLEVFSRLAGPTARTLALSLQGLSLTVKALTLDYEGLKRRIKEVNEESEKSRTISAIDVPGPQPVELPDQAGLAQAAQQAAQTADVVVSAAKRAANETNQALNAAFEQGRIDREQQALDTIAANARVLDAEKKRINAQLALKDQEARELQRREDLSAVERTRQLQKLNEDAEKLRQQAADAESLFETTARELRARAAAERANSRRNQIQNETEILIGELDRQVKEIEAAIQRGEQVETTGLTVIEQLERAKIDARRESLQEQQRIGFLTIEVQKQLDAQIRQLDQDADRLKDDQQQRRFERQQADFERQRQQRITEIESLLEAERIAGESIIASVQAQAALRIRTEDDAAREVLRIRLELIDDETEAVKAQLNAAASISEVNQRTQAQTELNNRLRLLQAQRRAIQSQGNRDIAAAQQTDLDNHLRYAAELEDIQERIANIQRDTAADVIRQMQQHFAGRRDIIEAETQLALNDEDARHQRALNEIDQLAQENTASNRTQQEKLEVEKELNRLREAEAERHRQEMAGIREQGRRDAGAASPLGQFDLGTEQLRDFARTIENSIIPLGETLKGTFLQVADAIGQTVANWVLLGETGPAVMRKILAQALASIAAEAAVNAIKELALGFATLFFNPAESASHFTAAALWGSIAGVSAIAGRGVAGDLFKQKSPAGSDSEGRSSSPEALQTIVQGRNQAPQVNVTVTLQGDDSKLANFITASVVSNIGEGGEIREVIARDGR